MIHYNDGYGDPFSDEPILHPPPPPLPFLAPGPPPSMTSLPYGTYRMPYAQDPSDIPLLHHDTSQHSFIHVDPNDDNNDNKSVNNIRYGCIPQCVPWRYKTIKKVECVSSVCVKSAG
ncbi:hypothetical protein C0992_011500 [Termitomyces sp. T32_za158]|nr:hypothetical protein C0992_011500 [Termitomyces sp. T32_za158]